MASESTISLFLSRIDEQGVLQITRMPALDWTRENRVLSDGEFGLETDTRRIKIGNGATRWNLLTYLVEFSNSIDSDSETTAASSAAAKALNQKILDLTGYGVDQNAAVLKGTILAKGDLIIGTSQYQTGRLPVGGNGSPIVADSSAPGGVSYYSGKIDEFLVYIYFN